MAKAGPFSSSTCMRLSIFVLCTTSSGSSAPSTNRWSLLWATCACLYIAQGCRALMEVCMVLCLFTGRQIRHIAMYEIA